MLKNKVFTCCNHAVGFAIYPYKKSKWIFYSEFIPYRWFNFLNIDLFLSYNVDYSFDYCPFCGKSLRKEQKEIRNIIANFYGKFDV